MGTLEELIGMTTGDDTVDANVTFVVEDSTELNNSVVHLSPVTMEDLNIWYGVAILLEGKNNRKAVCTVLTDENCGENKIRMNEVVRSKFGVSLGDSVSLSSFLEIPKGKKIVVRPIRDGCDFVQENLFESYLRPYFFGANRPVNNGDVFSVKGRARTIQFKMIKVFPSPFCIVGPSTVINCEEQKVANKRRKMKSVGVSKIVKGPAMYSQSSEIFPEQNIDSLLTQKGVPVPSTTVDKLQVPTVNKVLAPILDKLPLKNIDKLKFTTTFKLPVQNCETSSVHSTTSNDEIDVGKIIKVEVIETTEPSEPTTLEAQIELAHSLHRQGELQKAGQVFLVIKEAQERKYGRKHPNLLPTRLVLATILYDSKQFEPLLNIFLEDEQLQNCWDPVFLEIKLVIAMVLTEQNKFEDARRILDEALERVKSIKFSFSEIFKVKVLLATVLYSQNKWEDALKLLSHKTVQGPRFPDKVAKFMYVLKKLTQHKKLKLLFLALAKRDVLIIKCYIGWFYCQLKNNIKATRTLQEALPFMKKRMGSEHFYSQFADRHLQECKKQMLQERERTTTVS